MKHLITILGIILLCAWLMSCSVEKRAQRHVRIADKHLLKAKALDPSISRLDTIWKEVTVSVPEIKTDTFFIDTPGDTTYITKDKIKIKYIRVPGVDKHDSIFIDVACPPDTVRIKVPCVDEKIIRVEQTWWQKNQVWIIIVLIVSVVGGGVYLLKR